MEQLIPLVSRLHNVMARTGQSSLELPVIAVVGAQSVGKSSVLEAMVGRSFLPKGPGIVTRRPLILQLRYEEHAKEHGEFAHKRGQKLEDFKLIEQEINQETARLLGETKNVSSVPIFLKIVSPRVVNLTLIDLPGITKVPVGDQTDGIEEQIRTMIKEYIVKPSCIILALTSANTDIATSDSLQMAREVDPEGIRTIGVITKCDMVEDASSALDVLQGNIYRLRRGYVGVVCKEMKAQTGNQHNHEEEARFFRSHPVYGSIASKCGVRYLSQMLNEILTLSIKEVLPNIKTKVITLLQEKESELPLYSFGLGEDTPSPSGFLLHFFTSYSQTFQNLVDGRASPQQRASQLVGGARINYIFSDNYLRTLMEFHPLEGLSEIEIRAAIRNSTGTSSALFVPEVAFANLVKKQIKLLEQPSLRCVDQVYEELLNILESCDVPDLMRFTNLKQRIMAVVKELLHRCVGPTKEMIRNIIKIELAYINTNHPDFLKSNVIANAYEASINAQKRGKSNVKSEGLMIGSRSSSRESHDDHYYNPHREESYIYNTQHSYRNTQSGQIEKVKASYQQEHGTSQKDDQQPLVLPDIPKVVSLGSEPTEREVVEAQLIKTLIESYFCIVRKNIADAVPKCIMCFMVNKAVETLQQELISQLYRTELFEELTTESKEVIEKRDRCIESIKILRQCLTEINELTHFGQYVLPHTPSAGQA